MAVDVTQMRKGLLEYCVLSLLSGQPRYGYELVQELAKVDGMLTTEGTIYPLLARRVEGPAVLGHRALHEFPMLVR